METSGLTIQWAAGQALLTLGLLIAYLAMPACTAHTSSTVLNDAMATAVAVEAPVIRSSGGSLRLDLDVLSSGPSGAPVFSYRGVMGTAPTLRIHPGDALYITLHNRLPWANFTANAVNIHFHGFDVSPNAPQDDVTTMLASPGQTLRYVLRVPKSQQPGLYWYHPHSHGEAYWQVTSGMSGAIIVEGLEQRLTELSGLRQRLFIFRDVQDHPNIFGVPWYARKQTVAIEIAAARTHGITQYQPTDPDDVSSGGSCMPERYMHVTIEGTQAGTISIAPGEKQLLRILNASASRVFDIAVDGGRLGLVAVDGYPISAYPGTPHVAWVKHVVVPPAGRVEFLVVGQDHETVLRSRCYDSGPAGDRDPAVVLARLVPENVAPNSRDASGASSGHVPRLNVTRVDAGAPVTSRVVIFTEDGNGYYIDRRAFEMKAMEPIMTVHSGTLERWSVVNETNEVHAFHIHQIHFVLLAVNGEPVSPRYWADTALIPPQRHLGNKTVPGRVTLLMDFRSPAIRGVFPFHCHMLDHEDGGMMALVAVK